MTPLDVVKCNMQANPKLYSGLLNGFSGIYRAEGVTGIFKGWLPTCIGYHMQGMVKFGFNEIFKD